MAVNANTIDRAEWTFCVEREGEQTRALPWAFLKFGGDDEERKYVVPLPPFGLGVGMLPVAANVIGWAPYRQYQEVMPFRAFPLDSARGSRAYDDPPGTVAVHFFGGV